MKRMGGNLSLEVQVKTNTVNAIGEQVQSWATIDKLAGFLDLVAGDSKYLNYVAKISESTHVFVCQYKLLDERIKCENARIFNPKTQNYYEITFIDNPMELNYHLEFYLKLTGGQNA